jgi:protein-disulfide isomerase
LARKPPPSRSPLAPFYAVIGVIALVGIGILAYTTMRRPSAGADQPMDVAVTQQELSRVPGISMGREDAPVVIYEFADFECPHCAEWASLVEPLIRERLVQPGTVRYVFYDFPLGGAFRHSFLAARAGRCANEQGKFWEYHDRLFARQPSWAVLDDPSDFFVDLAREVGVDAGAFEQCLRSDKYQREVSLSRQLGESLNVRGTPTLFVNGEKLQTIPSFQELERIVREKAGQAAPADTAAPAAADSAAAPR